MPHTRFPFAVSVLLSAAALTCLARAEALRTQSPAATGVIVGRVLEDNGTTPISNVVVSLSGPGKSPHRVLVDPSGRFAFAALPAGSYTITSAKHGYLDGAYGKLRPDGAGRDIELQDGERVTNAMVKMWHFATISGTVTDDAGDPVGGAQVQVWRRVISAGHARLTFAQQSGYSDDRGAYRIIGLMPGDYAVGITQLTSSAPASLATAVAAAQVVDGPARDEFSRVTATNGTGGLANDFSQKFSTSRVGDQLLQGSAVIDGSILSTYRPVWYPSNLMPSLSALITLAAGDNRTGIDLQRALAPSLRISGRVSGPSGPMPWLQMRLVPASIDDVSAELTSSLSQSFNVSLTATDADGAFTFLGVPPGQYLIRAITTPPAVLDPQISSTVIQTGDGMSQSVANGPRLSMLSRQPSLWATVPVSVGDKDLADVAITMTPTLHITGHIEFDGSLTKPSGPALRSIRITAEPADGHTVWYPTMYQGQVTPDGEFYSPGLMPGSYVLHVDSAPAGWTVKSAMLGDRDIVDTPVTLRDADANGLVLTFTDHPARLDGLVRDGQGRGDDAAAVVIFPADGGMTNSGTSSRRIRNVRTTRTGSYSITNLPAGTYLVVAIGEQQSSEWQDRAFLQRLSRIASRVTIADGQGQSLDLTTTVVR